jgi:hypothetical protein
MCTGIETFGGRKLLQLKVEVRSFHVGRDPMPGNLRVCLYCQLL